MVAVTRLLLKHFRNYHALELTLEQRCHVFLGENGHGKTNILEALYFLSNTRSFRAKDERTLIEHQQTIATVEAQLEASHRPNATLKAILQQSEVTEKRLLTRFLLNGDKLPARSHALGVLPTVSFFLPDLLLLRGTPEDRRRWLDMATAQWQPQHLLTLNDYTRIRKQKTALLKQSGPYPNASQQQELSLWNEQLAAMGEALMDSRNAYLAAWLPVFQAQFQQLGPTAEISASYQPACGFQPLAQALQEHRSKELLRGQCLVGPHRDDVVFTYNGTDACAYASQGQQRRLVLAGKLAELALLAQRLQESPVLLLDDVMAELDPTHQEALLAALQQQPTQVLLSTTHLSPSLTQQLATLNPIIEHVVSGCIMKP